MPNSEGLLFAPTNVLNLNPINLATGEFVLNFWFMQDT